MEDQRIKWTKLIKEEIGVVELLSEEKPVVEAMECITGSFSEKILRSRKVKDFFEEQPKGKGNSLPDSPALEIQRYVAKRMGDIDKSDAAVNADLAEDFIRPVVNLLRANIRNYVLTTGQLNEPERKLLLYSLDISDVTDLLWLKWYRMAVVPLLELSQSQKKKEEERLSEIMDEYDYSVVSGSERMPWSVAFSGEIKDLSVRLRDLSDESTCRAKFPEMTDYFKQLNTALVCRNNDLLDDKWTEVDRRWIMIPSYENFVPIHGMESGYSHPFGVSPEFRLNIRTERGKDLIFSLRRKVPEYARSLGLDGSALHRKLQYIDVSVFIIPIYGGSPLISRIGGQVVPNRQEVLEQGGKIFIDVGAVQDSLKVMMEKVSKHCTGRTTALIKDKVDTDLLIECIASHEFFHPVGVVSGPENFKSKEVKKYLEETKATVGGILVSNYHFASSEHRLALAARSVARICRMFRYSCLNDHSLRDYVKEAMVVCDILWRSEVISLTEKGIELNEKNAASELWIKEMEVFLKEVLDCYKAFDSRRLEKIAGKYHKNAPFISDMVSWINR
ncbi:MAG: hypothetical protein ACLFTS_00875 [Candidatus Paceibacterota bacterium]